MKTTNKRSRNFVETMTPFQASNLSGKFCTINRLYIVYSYNWYPLLVFCFKTDKWFENSEKYSASTSRQLSQCRPHANTTLVTHEQLKSLITG